MQNHYTFLRRNLNSLGTDFRPTTVAIYVAGDDHIKIAASPAPDGTQVTFWRCDSYGQSTSGILANFTVGNPFPTNDFAAELLASQYETAALARFSPARSN